MAGPDPPGLPAGAGRGGRAERGMSGERQAGRPAVAEATAGRGKSRI